MATKKTNWKELYTNLPDAAANALREARLQPEQVMEKSDGELLSIEGINDKALEAIRAEYPAKLVEAEKPAVKKEDKTEEKVEEKTEKAAPKKVRVRSGAYKTAIRRINKDQSYALKEALIALYKISAGRKVKTLEMHLNLIENGIRGEAKLPFSTGKQIRIEIFSDTTVTSLNANEVNFDVLLARPADMVKLARYAKLLGPKGLMPNPKNGTIIENPEHRAEDLKKGATFAYKSEPKSPLMHLTVGKIDQNLGELEANIKAIVSAITARKIKSAFLKTTHSPSIKLDMGSI